MSTEFLRTAEAIESLDPTKIPEAARILSEAFKDDRVGVFVCPDDGQREAVLGTFFETILRHSQNFTLQDTEGAVLSAIPPQTGEAAGEEPDFSGLVEVAGEEALMKLGAVGAYMETLHQREMPEPHWYVQYLGVDPKFQGNGLGSETLDAFLRKANNEKMPVYLWTVEPRNVGYYEKFGFKVRTHGTEPTSGIEFWTMERKTAESASRSVTTSVKRLVPVA
jgi:ribosomal protein S18 acetylase RimI-like enzyme